MKTLLKTFLWSLLIIGAAVSATTVPLSAVKLQGLDKVTGRIFDITAKIDEAVGFGALTIIPRAGYKSAPEDPPESAVFLEIYEKQPDQDKRQLFSSWMFASSPSISTLEHPVYDVWVVQ